MKKVLFLFLISIFVLVGCSDDADADEKDDVSSNDTEEVAVEDNETDAEEDEERDPIFEAKERLDEKEAENEEEEVEIYSDDVKEFVESFNQLASLEDDVDQIEDIAPAVENEDGFTQNLYNSSDYVISANYDKEGEVESYIVGIGEDQPYEDMQGSGLFAMLHVAQVLDLNLEDLAEDYEKALPDQSSIHLGDKYTVTFTANEEIANLGMVVIFMNLAIEN